MIDRDDRQIPRYLFQEKRRNVAASLPLAAHFFGGAAAAVKARMLALEQSFSL